MSNQSYLFSVVIPTYNRSSDLSRCLESLVAQNYKNFEVIICDNASTDNTKETIEKFKTLLNIKYICLSQNSGGPAKPRNIGSADATGEWICFLDSDDTFLNDKLDKISKQDLNKMDFIYHDLYIIQNGIVIKKMKSRHLSVKDPYHDLLYGSYGIPTSSVCVRKDFFTNSNGFAEVQELVGLEDFNLWLQLAKNGIRFKYMPLALGTYFLGTENLSFNDENRIFRYKYLFKKIIDSEENSHTKKKLSATLNYYISWIYFNNRNFKKAILPTIHSLCYGSISIKLAVFRSVLKALIKV